MGDAVPVTLADLGGRAVRVPLWWCHPELRAACPGSVLGKNRLISALLLFFVVSF